MQHPSRFNTNTLSKFARSLCLLSVAITCAQASLAYADNIAITAATKIEETSYPQPYQRFEHAQVDLYQLPSLAQHAALTIKNHRLLSQLIPNFGQTAWIVVTPAIDTNVTPATYVEAIEFSATAAHTPSIQKRVRINITIDPNNVLVFAKVIANGRYLALGQRISGQADQLSIYDLTTKKKIKQLAVDATLLTDVEWSALRQQLAIITSKPCGSYAFQCHGSSDSKVLWQSLSGNTPTVAYQNGPWNQAIWGGFIINQPQDKALIHTKNEATRFDSLMTQPESFVWNWQTQQKVVLQKPALTDPRNDYYDWPSMKFSHVLPDTILGIYQHRSAGQPAALYAFSSKTGAVTSIYAIQPTAFEPFADQSQEYVLGFYPDINAANNQLQVHRLSASGSATKTATQISSLGWNSYMNLSLGVVNTDKQTQLTIAPNSAQQLNIAVKGEQASGYVLLQATANQQQASIALKLDTSGKRTLNLPACAPSTGSAWCGHTQITAAYLGDARNPSAVQQIFLHR